MAAPLPRLTHVSGGAHTRALVTLLGALQLGACQLSAIDLEHRSCPCAPGWICDEATNTCSRDGTEQEDSGVSLRSMDNEAATREAGCEEDMPGCGDTPVCDGGPCSDADDDPGQGEPTTPVAACGNGIAEPGESCDDGPNNGEPLRCDLSCSGPAAAVCGNGVQEPGEACDEGLTNGEPLQCDLTCSGVTAPVCGNGVQEAGETCDDGPANGQPLQCNGTCSGTAPPTTSACGVVGPIEIELVNRQTVENSGADAFVEVPKGRVVSGVGLRVNEGVMKTLSVRSRLLHSDGSFGSETEHRAGSDPDFNLEVSVDLPDCHVLVAIGLRVDDDNATGLYLWGAPLEPDGSLGNPQLFQSGSAVDKGAERGRALGLNEVVTGVGFQVSDSSGLGSGVSGMQVVRDQLLSD